METAFLTEYGASNALNNQTHLLLSLLVYLVALVKNQNPLSPAQLLTALCQVLVRALPSARLLLQLVRPTAVAVSPRLIQFCVIAVSLKRCVFCLYNAVHARGGAYLAVTDLQLLLPISLIALFIFPFSCRYRFRLFAPVQLAVSLSALHGLLVDKGAVASLLAHCDEAAHLHAIVRTLEHAAFMLSGVSAALGAAPGPLLDMLADRHAAVRAVIVFWVLGLTFALPVVCCYVVELDIRRAYLACVPASAGGSGGDRSSGSSSGGGSSSGSSSAQLKSSRWLIPPVVSVLLVTLWQCSVLYSTGHMRWWAQLDAA